jgi:FMN phosphatase YigB (HAD superfamily)
VLEWRSSAWRWASGHDDGVPRFKAVLLDWRGTMVADPEDAWWVMRAYGRLGRAATREQVQEAVAGLAQADGLDEVRDLRLTADCSPERHRAASMRHYTLAGLDAELADALYDLDFEPECHPIGVEVPAVLHALKEREVRVALVCDIHFDLRTEFRALGIDRLVDVYVLSFEHHVQKPDPRMFRLALDGVGVGPEDALMVGDRPSRDGGAVAVGITTLIAPTRRTAEDTRLDRALALVVD